MTLRSVIICRLSSRSVVSQRRSCVTRTCSTHTRTGCGRCWRTVRPWPASRSGTCCRGCRASPTCPGTTRRGAVHVPAGGVLNGAEVFTLAAETVRQQLAIIEKIPELWTMRHNKNSFKVLVSFQRLQGRLSYMRAINMRCLSVHLLSSFYPQLRRYVSAGEDRRGGCDMVTFLSRRLQLAPDAVGRQRQRRLLRV